MDNKHKASFNEILNDNTSGSSELVFKINSFFLQIINDTVALKNSSQALQKKLNQFSAVTTYLEKLNKLMLMDNNQKLKNFMLSFDNAEEKKMDTIARKFLKKYKNISKILTISRSGTLLKVFKILSKKNRKLKITVLESRPASEGKLMAKSIAKSGIKVELIPDAMMGIYVKKVDAVLIGADKILSNGNVVNKTGSYTLALLCKHFKKPFLVLTTRSKFSGQKKFKPKKEKPEEVWNFRHNNLTITNIYFEEIDKKLITEIITE